MTTIRQSAPIRSVRSSAASRIGQIEQSRPQLRSAPMSAQSLIRGKSPVMVMARTAILGLLAISALSLVLNIMTSKGVYELADLKREKKELIITSQILAEQVDSLSSDQNLTSAAHQLGMVANTNPVFLRVEDHKIFGKPRAAVADTSSRINGSLVPNAAQVKRTKVAALLAAEAEAKAARAAQTAADQAAAKAAAQAATASGLSAAGTSSSSGVAKPKVNQPQVLLSQIPGSPTR